MNEQRIYSLVNEIFRDVKETDKAKEQKEEIITHLTERVNDYMSEGLSFDDAFEAAKNDLGDLDELLAGFKKKTFEVKFKIEKKEYDDKATYKWKWDFHNLVTLAPFIYVIMGITQHLWQPGWWEWGWWRWGWVIIPMMPIIVTGRGLFWKLPAISPFIYILLGVFLGWWAWGWLIIPLSAILIPTRVKRKSKKKK